MAWVLKKLKSVAEVTRFAKTNATEVSGVSQTNVTEAVESPELFLKLATECMHRVCGVMSTAHSLKFNHNQSKYLAWKCQMAVRSADWLSPMNSTSSSTKFGSMELCLETFKLLFVLSSKVEAFIGSCCKEAWIKSAILLETNMMEHISSLGFMLEFCRRIFITASSGFTKDHTCLTKVSLSEMSNAETQVVEEKARLDHARLYKDLTDLIRSSESSSEEWQLATFLLGRLSMDGGLHPGSDVPRNRRSRLKILKESLSVLPQKLGKGAVGTVHKATWLGADVAVKTFHGPSSGSESDFMKEVSILDGLCHPNIGALLWHTVNEQEGRTILELMDDDLYSFMRNRLRRSPGSAPFTISEAVDIMLQVAEGMLFLHEKHIVHRDLKSGNILVKCVKTGSARFDYLHVKVADFGLSKTKEKSMTYSNQTKNMGTTRWMAPEMIKIMSNDGGDWKANTMMKLKHPFKSDVYSFGMVCYEILTGYIPFHEISRSEVKKRILNGDHPDLPSQCPHTLKRLIEDCWSFEASNRPKFGEICAQLRHIKWGPFIPLFCRSCEVCNNFCPRNAAGLVEFRTLPFWNMKYCPDHERDGTPRCCSCDRLENKVDGVYAALEDGRRVCPECSESAVVDTKACQPLYRGILKFYRDMGMPIVQNITVLLLNAAGYIASEVQGICISEEQTEPAVPQVSSDPMTHMRIQKLTRHCEVTAILVHYGLPRLLTGSILASLLMHAWLRLQGTYSHLRPEVELGLRSVMSHTWLTRNLKC